MSPKKIVIVGAGPIGLEAALYARRLGHEVRVLERGRIGDNVRRWGFCRLFSPAGFNRSTLGQAALAEAGIGVPDSGTYQTGNAHVESYLEPLARTTTLAGRVHEGQRVVAIGRRHLGKRLPLGAARAAQPFVLLVDGPDGEHSVAADAVLDCSGTYGNANALGTGNVPAPGERAARERIAYLLEDIRGSARDRYAGRRVLLVGSGHSAATALDALAELPGTRVTWIARDAESLPCPRVANDPLPERDRLAERANALAAGGKTVRFLPGTSVTALREVEGGLEVALESPVGNSRSVTVDRVIAHVGYRPDRSLYRELQVHECYASEGPMKLAATLLAGASADCLNQAPAGAETLVNPEPGFFVLGAKSYGRNSQFLIRLGLAQVREAFTLIEQRPELNLYAA